MAIDYSLFRFSKGQPRVLGKMLRERVADKAERECRAKVDARDGRQCFFPRCRIKASDKHHIVARSLGGKWTTGNIASACRRHHDWFKAGLIRVEGNPNRGPLTVVLTKLGEDAKIRIPSRAA
jgi:hypothetical protein